MMMMTIEVKLPCKKTPSLSSPPLFWSSDVSAKYIFFIYLRYSILIYLMATSRPSSSSPSSSAIVVHQLADLFRKNGHRVLHGDSKVCFTSDSLTLLNNYFQSAKLDITLPPTNGSPRTSSIPPLPALPPLSTVQHLRINTKLREDLVFLREFLQKIQAVKVC
jgi:hypothetical protein